MDGATKPCSGIIFSNVEDERIKIRQEWSDCSRCPLFEQARTRVFGEGPAPADLAIVGEAPGEQEDLTGRPFIGRSGELLNTILRSTRIERSSIFITNTVLCRPPNNETPSLECKNACAERLHRELYLVDPLIIIAMGGASASALTGKGTYPITTNAGYMEPIQLPGITTTYTTTMLPTYHPAYILRQGGESASRMITAAYDHFLMAKNICEIYQKLWERNP